MMERRISDLVDGIRAGELELEMQTPLNPRRIKCMVMNNLAVAERKKPKRPNLRALLIAAIIAALAIPVLAGYEHPVMEEQVFGAGDYVKTEEGAMLDEKQVDILNQMGRTFEDRVYEDQGTVVTVNAAYGDAYLMYLYLNVTAPKGTVLPDNIIYTFYDYNEYDEDDPFRVLTLGRNAPYSPAFWTFHLESMPDNDPTDNQKDFKLSIGARVGADMKLNDGYSKYLNIAGIYQQIPDVEGDIDGFELLVPCTFQIDITLEHEVEQVSLDVDGLRYGGVKTETWTHDSLCDALCTDLLTGELDTASGRPVHRETDEYEVTASSFTVSPLGVSWESSYRSQSPWKSYGLEYKVVMKDGTSPTRTAIGGQSGEYEGNTWGRDYFSEPIVLEEIDYILIGDPEVGEPHKVTMP